MAQYHDDQGALNFTLTDANYNVVGLTGSTGNVVEQYHYEPRASENMCNGSLIDQLFSSNPRVSVIR